MAFEETPAVFLIDAEDELVVEDHVFTVMKDEPFFFCRFILIAILLTVDVDFAFAETVTMVPECVCQSESEPLAN